MSKLCNICSIELNPVNKYPKRRRCKECQKQIKRDNDIKWREQNPDKQKEYDKKSLIKKQVETICECGCRFQIRQLKRHQKSQKHINFFRQVDSGFSPL